MSSRLASVMLDRYWSFALILVGVLFVLNVVALPEFVTPDQLPSTIGTLAPFVIAAIATTPAVLSGNGGIDLSIGPVLGVVNAVIIVELMPRGLDGPLTLIPIVLTVGALIGLINGLLVTLVRLQPVVATLGVYLILIGVAVSALPQPIGTAPDWIANLNDSYGPVPGGLILIAVPVAVWLILSRTSFHRSLLAVGGSDRAAYASGINVTAIRILAYTLGGTFAAIGGIALTALIQSGDATIAPQYTITAIAAVALGGVAFTGGRGGIFGPILGATSIFLIQNALAAYQVSTFWVQVAFGLTLVVAVVVNSVMQSKRRQRLEPVL